MSKNISPKPWRVEYDQPYCADLLDANGDKVKGVTLWLDDAPVPDYNVIAEANFDEIRKCVNLHDEMLAVLKATLESLLPYDKEGKMSAIVVAVCDVIKKAEAP